MLFYGEVPGAPGQPRARGAMPALGLVPVAVWQPAPLAQPSPSHVPNRGRTCCTAGRNYISDRCQICDVHPRMLTIESPDFETRLSSQLCGVVAPDRGERGLLSDRATLTENQS